MIIAIGRRNRAGQGLDRGGASIGELDHGDNGVFISPGRNQRDPVVATGNRQHQIAIKITRSDQVFQRDAGPEQQGAFAIGAAVAFDPIMPVTARKAVDIVTTAADQNIVARAAGERFVGRGANQAVVLIGPGRRSQRAQPGQSNGGAIGELDTVHPAPGGIVAQNDLVLAIGEGQDQLCPRRITHRNGHVADRVPGNLELIGARCIVDHIAAIAARETERIVACPAADLVIAGATGQHIVAAAANHDVVAIRLLAVDRSLDQIGDLPDRAIAEFNRRHRARTERALDQQLIAGARKSNDQVSRICARQPHSCIADAIGLQRHSGAGHAAGHFDAVNPVKRGQFNPRILRQHDPVMTGTGRERAARRQFAQIDAVLAFVGQAIANNVTDLRQGQRGAICKLERLNRLEAVSCKHRQGIASAGDCDHQITVDIAEGEQILGNLRPENDPIDPAGIGHAIAAIADPEAIGIVAKPALKRVRTGPAGKCIGPVIQSDQALIISPAGQHPIDHLIDAPAAAIGEFEPFDLRSSQPAHDRQHINAAAKIKLQVIAVAANNDVLGQHRGAEDHAINHARRIAAFDDPVEPVTSSEGIGIGAVAAVQRIVALPPIKRVGLVEQAFDLVVAAVSGDAQQVFFDELDRECAAVEEAEFLDFKVRSGKLVADQQAVTGAPSDGDQQVVTLLGPAQLFEGYPAAESDRVLDRHVGPAPILPARPHTLILNHIVAITGVELVDIAAIAADQQIVTAAPVEHFAKVGASDRLGRISANEIEILRVDVEEIDCAIGEHQLFHRKGLHPLAHVLVLQHEPLPGGPDRDDQIERRAREIDRG